MLKQLQEELRNEALGEMAAVAYGTECVITDLHKELAEGHRLARGLLEMAMQLKGELRAAELRNSQAPPNGCACRDKEVKSE